MHRFSLLQRHLERGRTGRQRCFELRWYLLLGLFRLIFGPRCVAHFFRWKAAPPCQSQNTQCALNSQSREPCTRLSSASAPPISRVLLEFYQVLTPAPSPSRLSSLSVFWHIILDVLDIKPMLALAFLTASLACSLDTSVIAGRIIATTRNETDTSDTAVPQIPDAFYAEVGVEQRVPFPSAVPLADPCQN